MNYLSLGSVPRPYDVKGNYERGFTQPLHRLDDGLKHMRKDERGELMVLADCGKHYVMQAQRDLLDGVIAPCDKTNERGFCMGPRVMR